MWHHFWARLWARCRARRCYVTPSVPRFQARPVAAPGSLGAGARLEPAQALWEMCEFQPQYRLPTPITCPAQATLISAWATRWSLGTVIPPRRGVQGTGNSELCRHQGPHFAPTWKPFLTLQGPFSTDEKTDPSPPLRFPFHGKRPEGQQSGAPRQDPLT